MKLTVFGCSFGDYLNGDLKTVYGQELATALGYQYQHESAGGGSNHRMWRRYWQLDQEGRISDQDIVIIQYTNPERCEFHRVRKPYSSWNRPADHQNPPSWNEEVLADGVMLRWKLGADQWANTAIDRDFFKTYQDHYVSTEWAEQDFQWRHSQFCWALKGRGRSRVLFLRNRIMSQFDLPPEFQAASFTEPWPQLTAPQFRYKPDDVTHMNHRGHRTLAGLLAQHIRNLGWV